MTTMTTDKGAVTSEVIEEKMREFFLRRASIKKKALTMDLNLEKALDENIFILGHVLLDLHETFGIQPTYEPMSEFEVFDTPQKIMEYVKRQLLIEDK